MKIGILGGTFDPVHQGHLQLARAVKQKAGLDKILFVPAFIPPHKAERRDITPAPYRYRMVEIAINNDPSFEISDVEYCRPEISYTVDTLRELKKKYPGAEFFLIMGSDAAAEFDTWREPEEILRLAKIIAVKRPDAKSASARPESFDSGTSKQLGTGSASARPEILWIEMPPCPLSSSELRSQIQKGKLEHPQDLPEGVEEFIRNKKLYGGRLCHSS